MSLKASCKLPAAELKQFQKTSNGASCSMDEHKSSEFVFVEHFSIPNLFFFLQYTGFIVSATSGPTVFY